MNIEGYENYEVKPNGDVVIIKTGRVLKPFKTANGYLKVCLHKNGKLKNYSVHRLVAQAFIPNPDNLPCVNHKDEVKTNNNVENLEWCTYKYNANYGTRIERIAKTQHETGVQINNKGTSKAVYQYTTNGLILNVYPSIREVKRIYNFDDSCIVKCCKGKLHSAYGYKWSYTLLFPPAVIPMS